MKKIISLFLATIFMFSFTGCNQPGTNDEILQPESNIQVTPDTVYTMPDDYPPVNVMAEGNIIKSADILTDRLLCSIILSAEPEQPVFNYEMLLCLISGVQDEEFCYYGIFPHIGYNTQFKTTNAEKIVYQLLNDGNWDARKDFGTPPNGGFNEATSSYEFSTDFGWGMQFYHAKDNIVTSRINDDSTQVVSTFELLVPDSSSGDPDHKSVGQYCCIYDIITENGETFLRFNRFEKI